MYLKYAIEVKYVSRSSLAPAVVALLVDELYSLWPKCVNKKSEPHWECDETESRS